MAELKPVYLVHGDDHGAIAERRAGLRALGERESGADGVELLEGERATPSGVAGALAAMTLALGQRVILVDGVERWKEAEVERELVPALAAMPPATTLGLFAREEARNRAPAALHGAVIRAGGQVVAQATVKPWELPKWTRAQAARLGLELDPAAAKALIASVGERQQRLLRELEKLALERDAGADARVSEADIEQSAARSSERRAYSLADALLAGDAREATSVYLTLRQQGERITGLTYVIASRLRDALAVSLRLQQGESPATVKRGLRMPARAADRLIASVRDGDPERLRGALVALADLELDTRGGSPLPATRTPACALPEDTLALRLIEAVSAPA
jgi:DNA polymerase III subunit delta